MIPQDRKLPVWRPKLTEITDIGLDLPGSIVHEVAGKDKEVAFLGFGQVDPPLHSCGIIKAAGMNVGQLGDGKSIKCSRKIGEVKGYFMYPVIVFAFEHGIEEARKRN